MDICRIFSSHRTPEDIKGLAVFLAGNASDFVNGYILYVDGGILAYIGRQPDY
jgi:gluconate 5-dehydrogenase